MLADYFRQRPEMIGRELDELPWQLRHAEEWTQLKDLLTQMDVFCALRSAERWKQDLQSYWLALKPNYGPCDAYRQALDRWEAESEQPQDFAVAVTHLGRFHYERAEYSAAEPLYRRALALDEQRDGAHHPSVARDLNNLAAFAVTVVVGQVLFFPDTLSLIAFEIVAMLLAVMLLRLAKIEAWHESWLNNRHLAERLRTAMFTVLVGRTATLTAATSPGVLPFYQGPEGWFLEPFRRILDRVRQTIKAGPGHHEAVRRFLVDGWIGNQAAWHGRNAERKRNSARRFHITGIVLFVTTLIMATLHLIGVGHEHPEGPPLSHAWHLVGLGITFLAITLPAWAGAVHAVGTLLDRERIAARSERMAEILDALAQRAEQAATLDELQTEVARAEEVTAAFLLRHHRSAAHEGPRASQ